MKLTVKNNKITYEVNFIESKQVIAIYNFSSHQSIYLFIIYNKITNNILIIYKLSNFDHDLSVVSQIKVSDGNRAHNHHANSLTYYPLDYQGTLINLT